MVASLNNRRRFDEKSSDMMLLLVSMFAHALEEKLYSSKLFGSTAYIIFQTDGTFFAMREDEILLFFTLQQKTSEQLLLGGFLYSDLNLRMMPRGQASMQAPQAVHRSGSITAKPPLASMAPDSQTFSHFLQAIQPASQARMISLPLSEL